MKAFDSTARARELTILSLLGQLEVKVSGLLRTMGWSQWKGNFPTFQFKGLSAMENYCHGALFQVRALGKERLENMTVHLASIPQPRARIPSTNVWLCVRVISIQLVGKTLLKGEECFSAVCMEKLHTGIW